MWSEHARCPRARMRSLCTKDLGRTHSWFVFLDRRTRSTGRLISRGNPLNKWYRSSFSFTTIAARFPILRERGGRTCICLFGSQSSRGDKAFHISGEAAPAEMRGSPGDGTLRARALTVFPADGTVPIDNIVSEHEMKRAVLNRKEQPFRGQCPRLSYCGHSGQLHLHLPLSRRRPATSSQAAVN